VIAVVLAAGGSSGDTLLDWVRNNASAVGILSLVVVALLRGTLVTGRECEHVRKERDRAMELVFEQAKIAQRALEVSTITKAKENA
jgi:hypothetical protein